MTFTMTECTFCPERLAYYKMRDACLFCCLFCCNRKTFLSVNKHDKQGSSHTFRRYLNIYLLQTHASAGETLQKFSIGYFGAYLTRAPVHVSLGINCIDIPNK